MAWALGTWMSNALASGSPVGETHDFPFYVRGWDENWDTPLGRQLAPLLTPFPSTRTTLDDDTGNGRSETVDGPSVAGGRRNQVIYRDRMYQAIFASVTEKKQPTPGVSPPIAATGDQSYLPIQMRYLDRALRYRLSTTQEGIHTIHPSDMVTAQYNDDVCRILSEVQRHFLEPVIDGGVSWNHGLWTADEAREAVYLRVQRFMQESEFTRKEATAHTGSGTVNKPLDLLVLRRVQWEYEDLRKHPRALTRIDLKQADQGYPGWDETTGEPGSFVEEPSPRSLDVTTVPPPDSTGIVGMRYVPTQELVGDCPNLGIPRMFSWAVKWGVVADLLHKEGEANDPVRAAAAEELYQLGVRLARLLIGEENG